MAGPTLVDDYTLIAATLTKYADGVVHASSAIMRPAFAVEATVFSVEDGEISGGPVEGLFSLIDTKFEASAGARFVISRVEVVGDVASARVDINDASGFCFSDFLHLLKVAGEWTIVGKVYHTHR